MKNWDPLLWYISKQQGSQTRQCLRVGTSVGHGQKEGLIVLEVEVLIGELLAPDGATTGTLILLASLCQLSCLVSYIATGEVTALEHELRNDAVEFAVAVRLSLGTTLADGAEVLRGLGDDIIKELEGDAAFSSWESISLEGVLGVPLANGKQSLLTG